MTSNLCLKAGVIWFLIAAFAMCNGIVREKILIPMVGHGIGLPVSGLMLSVIVITLCYLVFPWFENRNAAAYFAIGLQWVIMTLAFEFLFGHYVGGKSWAELLRSFNPLTGDLMALVIVITFLSPWLVAKLKGSV